MSIDNKTLLLLILNVVIMLYAFIVVPYTWFLTILFSAILYGALSPLISARRIYFLAAEAPHISLLSVALGIIFYNVLPILSEFSWALVLSLILIYVIAFAIRWGLDPDVVTSATVAFTASSSIIAISYVLSKYSIRYNLWSVILGDPLLTTRDELYVLIGIALIVFFTVLYIFKISIYIGIDTDYTKLHGIKLIFYDIVLFTFIGLASIALLKIIGFVLEHVLLLLPSLIAINLTEGSYKVLYISILSSIFSSILGLLVSIYLNIAPAGGVGIVAFIFYFVTLILKVRKRG